MPRRLGDLLARHETATVLTMDGNLEFQQNLAKLPIAVVVVAAISNRMEHLMPMVPSILIELDKVQPRTLRRALLDARAAAPPQHDG